MADVNTSADDSDGLSILSHTPSLEPITHSWETSQSERPRKRRRARQSKATKCKQVENTLRDLNLSLYDVVDYFHKADKENNIGGKTYWRSFRRNLDVPNDPLLKGLNGEPAPGEAGPEDSKASRVMQLDRLD